MKIKTILRISVVILTLFSVFSTVSVYYMLNNMMGDSRIVNYSGIVRGATQRLIKLESNGTPSDKLIEKLDSIISGLINGEESQNLYKVTDSDYQARIHTVQDEWKKIKESIYKARDNKDLFPGLIDQSEAYFEMTNQAVFAAEEFSKTKVNILKTV